MGAKQDWLKAVKDAEKLLGKDGELPKPRVDPVAVMDDANKSLAGFAKLRDGLESTNQEVQKSLSAVTTATKQYEAIISKDEFGLDQKDAKNKKTVADVRKILLGALRAIDVQADLTSKSLDKVDQALIAMQKIKPAD